MRKYYIFKTSIKVTNIKVAGDAREHFKRTEDEENNRLRRERLEQEAKAATEKFEEVICLK